MRQSQGLPVLVDSCGITRVMKSRRTTNLAAASGGEITGRGDKDGHCDYIDPHAACRCDPQGCARAQGWKQPVTSVAPF